MPSVSKRQARFLWAKKPKIAKKWAAEGEMSTKGLPESAPKPAAEKIRVRLPK